MLSEILGPKNDEGTEHLGYCISRPRSNKIVRILNLEGYDGLGM